MTDAPGDSVATIIKLYQRDVDRSILRGQLSRTPEQRFCDVMDRQAAAQAFRRAGRDGLRTR
jgi:hypothetical protein